MRIPVSSGGLQRGGAARTEAGWDEGDGVGLGTLWGGVRTASGGVGAEGAGGRSCAMLCWLECGEPGGCPREATFAWHVAPGVGAQRM